MPRRWNTTGLYRHQQDRAPAKRQRRLKGSPSAARLVHIDAGRDIMLCQLCLGEHERRHLIDDGETCPSCKLVGCQYFTGRNAAITN